MTTRKSSFNSLPAGGLSLARAASLRWTKFIAFAVLLLVSATLSYGIEGLTISVQNATNLVLGWPSSPNETYLIQYCPTLDPNDSWQELTNYYPASSDTNWTTFVITNAIIPASGGGGSYLEGGGPPSPGDAMPSDAVVVSSDAVVVQSIVLAPGDTMIPPSPWIPQTLPSGAIAKADGSYIPLVPPPLSAAYSTDGTLANGTTASPDDGTNGSDSQASPTGFFHVVRDGAHAFCLTNGAVLSGDVQFPLELGLDETDQIVGITFFDGNNSPLIGASAQGAGNIWTFDWNTPVALNGTYEVYAEVDFATNDSVVGFPVTVTVSNVISFPNYLTQMYGNQMWIYAQTIPNANYEIDMYDENTNYLGSFVDYADGNGVISFLWDLVDYYGDTNYNTNFYGEFTVDTSSLASLSSSLSISNSSTEASSIPWQALSGNCRPMGATPDGGSSSSAKAKQYWTHEPKWQAKDTWVVAYGLFAKSTSIQNADTRMIAGGIGEDEPYLGVLGTLDKYGLRNNLSPGNNPQAGQVFTVSDALSRSNLLTYLASSNYDNFYFFGHGNASSIGAYNGIGLTQGDISSALGNVPLSWPIMHAAMTPYRFVFIDGCDTGKGNFSEAFAIPAAQLSTNYYAAAGLESRAFVGFTSWKANFDILSWQGYSAMTHGFLSDWQSGVPVQQCVNNAKQDVYYTGNPMDSSAVVYGAIDLQHNTHTGQ